MVIFYINFLTKMDAEILYCNIFVEKKVNYKQKEFWL